MYMYLPEPCIWSTCSNEVIHLTPAVVIPSHSIPSIGKPCTAAFLSMFTSEVEKDYYRHLKRACVVKTFSAILFIHVVMSSVTCNMQLHTVIYPLTYAYMHMHSVCGAH